MFRSLALWYAAGLAVLVLLLGCQERGDLTGTQPDKLSDSGLEEKRDVAYFVSKLRDKEFTQTYSHGYVWYTAAEELGLRGLEAIPALIVLLDSTDPYELKLTLYALMLASQDEAVKAITNGDYLRLDDVLQVESNAANRNAAQRWWRDYGALIGQQSGLKDLSKVDAETSVSL